MKKHLGNLVRSALALGSLGLMGGATSALAGDNGAGFYVSADAGVNLESDLIVSDGSYSLNPGLRADGALGYGFNLGRGLTLAPQAEAGVMYNTMNHASAAGMSSIEVSGSYTQVPIMGDALLKWRFCRHWFVYGGGGAGCDINYLKIDTFDGMTINSSANETDSAWQVMGGIGCQVGPAELGLGYKYLAVKPSGLQTINNNTIFASCAFTF